MCERLSLLLCHGRVKRVCYRVFPPSDEQLRGYRDDLIAALNPDRTGRTAGALTTATTISETAAGLLAAGIVGALPAVPLLAVLHAGLRSLLSGDERLDRTEIPAEE